MSVELQVLISGALAGLVGLTEILTRYRSDPGYSLKGSFAAWVYVAINAAAGVGALFLVRAFGWDFGQTENVDLWRVLVAGFGAVALFRSSLFVAKVGNTEVNVGPSLVLGALLDTFDRSVDRRSAAKISEVTKSGALERLDPERVMTALPVLCLAMMQNFPESDQASLGAELLKTREDPDLTPPAKLRATVVHLSKYLGPDLVTSVIANARPIFEETGTGDAKAETVEIDAVLQKAKEELGS